MGFLPGGNFIYYLYGYGRCQNGIVFFTPLGVKLGIYFNYIIIFFHFNYTTTFTMKIINKWSTGLLR